MQVEKTCKVSNDGLECEFAKYRQGADKWFCTAIDPFRSDTNGDIDRFFNPENLGSPEWCPLKNK